MVEATEHAIPGRGGEAAAELARETQFVPTDLLLGRVTPEHRFAEWLTAHGARDADLAWLVEHPGSLDTMGVNFYPGWSLGRFFTPANVTGGPGAAEPRRRRVYAEAVHLEAVVRAWHERYGLPVMVTETSDTGSVERRGAWMDASIEAMWRLRAEGVPVSGYTWFPVLPHVNWDYRRARRPIGMFRAEMGLWESDPGESWRPYVETPLAERFRRHIQVAEQAA
jgi:hypothetical protein